MFYDDDLEDPTSKKIARMDSTKEQQEHDAELATVHVSSDKPKGSQKTPATACTPSLIISGRNKNPATEAATPATPTPTVVAVASFDCLTSTT